MSQSNSAASSNTTAVRCRVITCRHCGGERINRLFRGKWVDDGCGKCLLRAIMIRDEKFDTGVEITAGGADDLLLTLAIERLSACVESHRAGEAMSGYQVAHVEVPVSALEAVLKAFAK